MQHFHHWNLRIVKKKDVDFCCAESCGMGVLHFLSAWVNRHQQPEVGHLSKHERFQLQKKVLVGAQSWQIPQWHPQKEIIYIYIVPPQKKKTHQIIHEALNESANVTVCAFFKDGIFMNFQHHQEAELFEATFEFFSANALVVVWIKNLEVSDFRGRSRQVLIWTQPRKWTWLAGKSTFST